MCQPCLAPASIRCGHGQAVGVLAHSAGRSLGEEGPDRSGHARALSRRPSMQCAGWAGANALAKRGEGCSRTSARVRAMPRGRDDGEARASRANSAAKTFATIAATSAASSTCPRSGAFGRWNAGVDFLPSGPLRGRGGRACANFGGVGEIDARVAVGDRISAVSIPRSGHAAPMRRSSVQRGAPCSAATAR